MPSIMQFRGQEPRTNGDEMQHHQELQESIEVSIPTPLPFIISLLPLLLSPQVYLPASHLSTFVLLRHHFLKPLPHSSPSYLQASPKDRVEEAREYLAQFASCLEEIQLSQVDYSTRIEEFGRITARIKLQKDARQLVLLVIWEEAQDIQQHQPSGDQDGEVVEAGWRYYDLQLPTTDAPGIWHSQVQGALRDLIKKQKTSTVSNGDAKAGLQNSNHVSQHNGWRQPQEQEDGEERNPDDDFWAGVEDSDDEGQDEERSRNGNTSLDMDNDDDYWASYDSQDSESAIPDETAPPNGTNGDDHHAHYEGGQMSNGLAPKPDYQQSTALSSDQRLGVAPSSPKFTNGMTSPSHKAEDALRQNIRSLYNLYNLSISSRSPSSSDITATTERFLEIVTGELRSSH